ncbi:hypothetical protein [Klenkia sp. PcliD-1-E]|uniref:hypothetical protein n=1 Tax=Klenkia sp. PcliD-1-E TaxID=2954492 RepID=UPI0020970E44|nr:hypothetical protein [Klenkia sp. PcliD-1-E]MCO7222282.1 hypothetical protein [Klenkia sp. PcliD-1-E]
MRGAPVAVAALALLLAACSAGHAPTATTATPTPVPAAFPEVPGISGEVVRLRTDEALGGQVQVRLTDTGDVPVTVTAVALVSDAFAEQPPSEQTARYAPGRTIDLPVPFGAVDCAADVHPLGARVQLDRGAGPEEVVVPLAGDAMDLVAAEQCAAQRLAEHVAVTVDGFTEGGSGEDGDDVRGTVVLTRVDEGGEVRVEALGRSVLLEPVVPGLPATLGTDEQELSLPFTVGPASCDPHVLAETKKPFVFPLTVVAAGETAVVDLPLSDAQRGRLQALVDRVCG